MKANKLILFFLLALTLFSCKKDEEENPAKVTVVFTGEKNWNTVKNGEFLEFKIVVCHFRVQRYTFFC